MNRFHFEYGPVMAQRCETEEAAQQELARLLREKMVLESRVHPTAHGRIARDALADRLEALERRIRDAERRLSIYARRRRAIERLRDKHYRRWCSSESRWGHALLANSPVVMAAEI